MMNGKRKNGFLQIDNYEVIRDCSMEEGQNAFDWFKWNQTEYLFKIGSPEDCFYEYFWNQILKEINVDTVDYEMAEHRGFFGLISPNYNSNNLPKKSIAELLYLYKSFLQKEKEIKKSVDELYNLKDIKQMIDWYFQKEKNEIKESLKDCTIFRFIIQIICGDKDLHARNIEIYSKDQPVLSPIFDLREYGKMHTQQQEYRLKLNYTKEFESPTKTICKFIKTASQKEKELLQEHLEKLQQIKVKKMMAHIAEKLEIKISPFSKMYYQYILNRTIKNVETYTRKI